MIRFNNLDEVITKNKAIGQRWFDATSKNFFNCECETGLIKGKYFVTSERAELTDAKRFTVREALFSGVIGTVGDFMEYSTLEEAMAVIGGLD